MLRITLLSQRGINTNTGRLLDWTIASTSESKNRDRRWKSCWSHWSVQNLRLSVFEVSLGPTCWQHFLIKQHQLLVNNPPPHTHPTDKLLQRTKWGDKQKGERIVGRFYVMCMCYFGFGWVTALPDIWQFTWGEHFSFWSRAAYWQHYIIKMSKCSPPLLEHK